LAINAYKRHEKKLWMENRDNEDKCINCRHKHDTRGSYCGDNGINICICRDNKPLKFDAGITTEDIMKENYPFAIMGDSVTGDTSVAVHIPNIKLSKMDNRYCTDCGKSFEVEKSNPTDMCLECNGIGSLKDRASDSIGMVPWKRSGYKATPSLSLLREEKEKVNDGTRCLDEETCRHNNTIFKCECGCQKSKGVFYRCQWKEHRRIGKPHNSWIGGVEGTKSPLPPMTTEAMKLICKCDDRWGKHTSSGSCTKCDCEYFIKKQKEYLNCPGCGKEGRLSIKSNPKIVTCNTLFSEGCDIIHWSYETGKVLG